MRRIDTTTAQNILDRFAKNGYVYIPENIVNDMMIHCSCDNIDVLEATLDGRNTFYWKHMMVWQRGPVPQQSQDDSERKNVAMQPSALQEFKRLDHAHLPSGKRPPPSFGDDNTIEIEWFGSSCYEETNHSLTRELVEMENLLRLNSLCVTCMADLSSHPSTKPGCNCLAIPRRVCRCYPD